VNPVTGTTTPSRQPGGRSYDDPGQRVVDRAGGGAARTAHDGDDQHADNQTGRRRGDGADDEADDPAGHAARRRGRRAVPAGRRRQALVGVVVKEGARTGTPGELAASGGIRTGTPGELAASGGIRTGAGRDGTAAQRVGSDGVVLVGGRPHPARPFLVHGAS
jgi:hypothetical protein